MPRNGEIREKSSSLMSKWAKHVVKLTKPRSRLKVTMEILKSGHVHMKDDVKVLQKINNIIRGGPNKLQLIADFDFTLTKQHEDGKMLLSTMCIFEKSKQMPQSRLEESNAALEKYRPIEHDPKIPLDRKIAAMEEWYKIQHKLWSGFEYDRREIDEVTQKYGQSLRDRTKELFSKLSKHSIPILVFSAGLGDIIQTLFRQQDVPLDNVKIISNFLAFQGNTLMGFKNHENLIHVFNKNEHSVDHEYFELVQDRKNIILLGDSVGDATMAGGVENVENLLKIGFLYGNVEEKLPFYKEAFDIVLVNDQTMNVVLDILSFVL